MAEYIKREDALKALCEDCAYKIEECNETFRCAESQIILDVPSADVRKNIHARWKCTALGNYACSYCSQEPYYSGNIEDYHFCPYCGAEMRRADND